MSETTTNLDPYLASITERYIPIILAVGTGMALGVVLVAVAQCLPSLATYIMIPLALILMAGLGSAFLCRYFGVVLPMLPESQQDRLASKYSLGTLIMGVGLIVGFGLALITLLCKRERLSGIVNVLKISHIAYFGNPEYFVVSLVFSALSVGVLVLNLYLLQFMQSSTLPIALTLPVFLLYVLFMHGFIQAFSDFYFQAMAILWYFHQRLAQEQGQQHCTTLAEALKLTLTHLGTVVFGSILAYTPDFLTSWIYGCEQFTPKLYSVFCCLHKCLFRVLNRSAYASTILQSIGFIKACQETRLLKARAKVTIPELYMMGAFFNTLAKLTVLVYTLAALYVLLVQADSTALSSYQNLIGPCLVYPSLCSSHSSLSLRSPPISLIRLDSLGIPLYSCTVSTSKFNEHFSKILSHTAVPMKSTKLSSIPRSTVIDHPFIHALFCI